MSRGNKNRKDQSNVEKMKSEMRRRKLKAEALSRGMDDLEMTGMAEEGPPVVEEHEVPVAPVLSTATSSAIIVAEEHEVSVAVASDHKIELVVFQVGTEQFAFRLMNVREIVRVNGLRTIPNAPGHVAGLSSLRGSVLPVIDLRKCFHMPIREYDDDTRMIVADIHGRQVGMITDRILEVASIEVSAMTEPPSNIRNLKEGYVSGIVVKEQGKGIIMVLDAEKIINFQQLDDTFAKTKANGAGEHDPSSHTSGIEKLVVLNVGNENYALNIKHVKEILRYGELLNVPNSHYYVEGVLSVRNRLLAVINPGKMFGIPHRQVHESTRIVVVDAGAFSYGIVVDHVSEVASVPRNQFYNPIRIANNAELDCVSEFAKLNNGQKMVMVLDPYKLVSLTDLRDMYSGMKEDHHGIEPMGHELSKEQVHLEKIVVFRIDDGEYGIRIDYVREINNLDRIVSIPGTPDFISGMVSLRREIIPLMNLRVLFGIAENRKLPPSKFLVVEHKKERIGILIDSASEVLSLNKELFEDTPRLLEADNQKKYVHQICKLNKGKRTVMIVDLTTVFDYMP